MIAREEKTEKEFADFGDGLLRGEITRLAVVESAEGFIGVQNALGGSVEVHSLVANYGRDVRGAQVACNELSERKKEPLAIPYLNDRVSRMMKQKQAKQWMGGLVVCGVVAGMNFFGGGQCLAGVENGREVGVSEAVPDVWTSAEEAPGTVRPVETAMLSAKVSGTILEVEADPGRVVKEGDILARIDDREIRARLENARAALVQAERDYARFEKLHADRVVTTQEFEGAQTRLRSARATVEEAETLLAYCTVRAPFDGVVTRRLVQRGDLAVPGRALIEVENPGALRLEAQVPESLVTKINAGDELMVLVDAAGAVLPGQVVEISPASDPASRTVLVKLDLPAHEKLRSGQFGRLRIPTETDPVVRLPEGAVFSRGQLDFVFVAGEGVARLRIVRPGRRQGGQIEVLSGLDPGELVVVEGGAGLRDGEPVRVRR